MYCQFLIVFRVRILTILDRIRPFCLVGTEIGSLKCKGPVKFVAAAEHPEERREPDEGDSHLTQSVERILHAKVPPWGGSVPRVAEATDTDWSPIAPPRRHSRVSMR